MTFTDDDLKRVKRDLNGFISWASDDEVLALLARLEAAERLNRAWEDLEAERTNYDNVIGFRDMWRKAANK